MKEEAIIAADNDGTVAKLFRRDKSQKKHPSVKKSDTLQDVLDLMKEENLHELEITDGSFQVKLVRHSRATAVAAPVSYAEPEVEKEEKPKEDLSSKYTPVISPLAGVFYRSPSPKAQPFAKEGDVVTSDKTLCIIEAMKVLNEINAGASGRIVKILIENGKPVKSGETLFLLEPTA